MYNPYEYRDSLAFAGVSARDRLAAGLLAAICVLGVVVIAPISNRAAPECDAFLPVVVFVAAFALALTAMQLYSQYLATSHVPLAILGHGYAATAVLIVAYVLAFPHVFSETGLLGANEQTAPWLLSCWHVAFLALVGLFVVAKWRASVTVSSSRMPPFSLRLSSIALGLTLIAIVALAVGDTALPKLISGHQYTGLWYHVVAPATLALNLLVLLALFAVTRFRTLVALWLGVVLLATLAETMMVSLLPGGRFSYAWYFARAEWIVAATTFYFAMKLRMMQIMGTLSRRNHELFELATVDELTGLLNQRGFTERFERVARQAARSGDSLVFIAIDVDEFKRYNDEFGHPAGSRALAAIGSALANAGFRTEDFCGRVGGDEFAMVLFGVDLAGSLSVAERACHSIKMLNIRHAPDAMAETLTISVGIASDEGDSSLGTQDLVARADEALYQSKRSGRDRISLAPTLLKLPPVMSS